MRTSLTRTSLVRPAAAVRHFTRGRVWIRAFGLVLAAGGAACLTGCGGDVATGTLTLPPMAAADAYWSVEFNHRAINLTTTGPTSTVQLAVTPRTVSGAVITGVTATPVYTVGDPTALAVTSDGTLTARAPVDRAMVIAQLTIGDVTHVDTAYVRAFDAAPPASPSAMSIQPVPPDSAKWSLWFFTKAITPVFTAADGTPYENQFPYPLLVDLRSADPSVATFDAINGGLHGGTPGRTLLTASTYAFGAALRDTVTYTIGLPLYQFVGIGEHLPASGTTPVAYFTPDTVTIGAGGLVVWLNTKEGNTMSVAIVFDDSAAAHQLPPPFSMFWGGDSGNVAPLAPGAFGGRQFMAPGTYRYHDATNQAHGVIIVRAAAP